MVIAIIGILGAIIYAPFQTARRKGRDAQRVIEIKNMVSSLNLYADSHNGEFPNSLTDLQTAMLPDKLPSNANFTSTPNATKYNYTPYSTTAASSTPLVYGFHLWTHLETANTVLAGAAKCRGFGTASTSPCFSAPGAGYVTGATTEPADGSAGVYFTDHAGDSDSVCATDITRCILDYHQ